MQALGNVTKSGAGFISQCIDACGGTSSWALMATLSLATVLLIRAAMRKLWGARHVEAEGKTVLVTGCDSGFGRRLALRLADRGYYVLAGCLTKDGARSLVEASGTDRIEAFELDVTSDESVARAGELVAEVTAETGLWALVNNAGIIAGHLIDLTPMEVYQKTMDVNCWGGVRMFKAVRPALIQAQGRVVNVTSVAGRMATSIISSYNCSKFAFEAFSDCLRQEMAQWGVGVSIVEPGFFDTPILDKARDNFERLWSSMSTEQREEYGKEYIERVSLNGNKVAQLVKQDPVWVVNDLEHAVSSVLPRTRYKPGYDTWLWMCLARAPAGITDKILTGLHVRLGKPAALKD